MAYGFISLAVVAVIMIVLALLPIPKEERKKIREERFDEVAQGTKQPMNIVPINRPVAVGNAEGLGSNSSAFGWQRVSAQAGSSGTNGKAK